LPIHIRLERFGLPVEIVAGDIGKLSIKIPWGAMKDSPCRVEIDDVYILARAKPQGKVTHPHPSAL
jgi:vacuolar protein sorting-associated protein 13A/C